ncbi:Golgi integral membrane protein 4-like isoform X1 [Homalodisca vitripennis]|nr:Golgi integral membrane protein 4-like isoform X1 [Homalodisca vitripennis]
MTSARLVRSTKSRLFVYICAVLAFGMIVYMFHGSQLQLDDSRKSLASCNQQSESLSAQLQVIFEYKLRLEKSLQKEKTDHKQTRDECQNRARQDKDDRERELVEAANKYSALQQSTSLLQSKQKDLEEENNELRKKNLKLLDEIDIQKKQFTAKFIEEQQLRATKEKAIENVKNRNLELEVKYNKLAEEYEVLKKDKVPESSRLGSLEKVKLQLERELENTKTQLESCMGGNKPVEKRVSVGGVGDNQSGIEPPKFVYVNKAGVNATTPVINPEAVIDHDVSSPKPSLTKSTKTISGGETNSKPTQAAAAPLQMPLKQPEEPEVNRQIPMPHNLEHQSPENTVIKKPEYSDSGKRHDALADENQGGEVAGPMNPIQEPAAPAPAYQGHAHLEENKNKVMNAIQWDEEGPQNGAHEEGEEEAAPLHNGWRLGEEGENKVLPRHMNHDYQGLEYDKDNQEEEEDEEGEQMDYLGGDAALKQPKQMAKFRQFEHNGGGGGGIMLNPK